MVLSFRACKGVPGGLTKRPGTLAGSKNNRMSMAVCGLHFLMMEDDVREAWLHASHKKERKTSVFGCFEILSLTFAWVLTYACICVITLYHHAISYTLSHATSHVAFISRAIQLLKAIQVLDKEISLYHHLLT